LGERSASAAASGVRLEANLVRSVTLALKTRLPKREAQRSACMRLLGSINILEYNMARDS